MSLVISRVQALGYFKALGLGSFKAPWIGMHNALFPEPLLVSLPLVLLKHFALDH